MSSQEKNRAQVQDQEANKTQNVFLSNDAVEDDGTPVLDETDLEENHLSKEEADEIEWEEK